MVRGEALPRAPPKEYLSHRRCTYRNFKTQNNASEVLIFVKKKLWNDIVDNLCRQCPRVGMEEETGSNKNRIDKNSSLD